MAAAKGNGNQAIVKSDTDAMTLENFVAEVPQGGVLITAREGLYSPDNAKDSTGKIAPVVGWLVGVEEILSPKYKEKGAKPYLVVEVTQPTICTANQKPFLLKQGRALVPLSKALEGWEEKATHETLATKVCIQYLSKEKQANGNDFWNVEVRVLEVRERAELATETLEGMKAALEEANTPKQISAAAS